MLGVDPLCTILKVLGFRPASVEDLYLPFMLHLFCRSNHVHLPPVYTSCRQVKLALDGCLIGIFRSVRL